MEVNGFPQKLDYTKKTQRLDFGDNKCSGLVRSLLISNVEIDAHVPPQELSITS